jgi:hypothetical protein
MENYSRPMALRFLLGMALMLCSWLAYADHPDCDSRYVEELASKIVLAPSEAVGKDSSNLECAFKLAIHKKKPLVELKQGEYLLRTRVSVNNFNGTLSGRTIATTTVSGCSGDRGGIIFHGGSPTLTKMTFDSQGRNCDNHITVTSSPDSCGKNSTVFIKMDRILFRSDRYGDGSAIVIGPRNVCTTSFQADPWLLGKVLINRVDFEGSFDVAADIAMAGGAQVDVFFSNLIARDAGLYLRNTGANAQVVSSSIESTRLSSTAVLIQDSAGIRRGNNVLTISKSLIRGYGDAIYQDCSNKCFINVSDSEVHAFFGSPILTTRTGAFRIFDSLVYGDKSIVLHENSVMSNNDVDIFAIPDIRLLGGGNTINQPDNDVIAPAGSNNLISSRN